MTYQPTLRDRFRARYGKQPEVVAILDVPATGRIDTDSVAQIQDLATLAREGDNAARDRLFFALKPRLNQKSWILRSWPNTSRMTGLWDRDDVRQETWLVFAELLEAWNGEVTFVPFLLARFGWRLRDRILRGIGKSQSQYGTVRVPEELLDKFLVDDDAGQPESAAIAGRLLEALLRCQMVGATSPGELEAWLEIIKASEADILASPEFIVEDGEGGRQSRAS